MITGIPLLRYLNYLLISAINAELSWPRKHRIGVTKASFRKRDGVEPSGETFPRGQGVQISSLAVQRVGQNYAGGKIGIVVSVTDKSTQPFRTGDPNRFGWL